jgi:RHS repeat-associated protein
VDEDGLPDLEHGIDFTLFRQSANGTFVGESLPPPPAGADPACRPPAAFFNRARTLVRMAGVGSALQVMVLEETSSTTKIRVCDRAGAPQLEVEVAGHWHLDGNLKITDLNRDDKPDLLLVDRGDTGTYEVLENISGEGCPGPACVGFGFRGHPPRELAFANGFPFTPSGIWAHDLNGDGNPDLVLRSADRMSIWYGRGRFLFADQELQLPFLNRLGNELFNLDAWEVSWVDANKDGLTDALLALGNESALFLNEVDHFEEVVAPVLEHANTFGLGVPIVGDFRGQGDSDLNFIQIGAVSAVGLTLPSTGLLVGADDGKGTQVDFAYQRAPAQPGLRQRPSLLTSLTVETAGYDPVAFEYDYGAPRMHTVGHFLVGFGTVEVEGPQSRDEVAFYHDDQIAAQVETSLTFDQRTPGLMKFAQTSYEEALHAGVRVRRSQTSRTGWCSGTDVAACLAGGAPAVAETSATLAYERGICPTRVRNTNRHGQLETVSTLASPTGLSGALHCQTGGQTWIGTHTSSPARDFRHENRLTLNELGQVIKVEQLGGGEVLTLQEMTYDATTHRLKTVSAPGQGGQTFSFDANSGQLQSTTGADGVIASAQNRSPTTDALLELVGDRGPGGVLVSSFRYDGMERLATRWANFGGSSSAQPLETIAYQFPTTDFPALIHMSTLVDAVTQNRQDSAAWSYPDGAELTSAVRIPGRWVFGGVSAANRSELRTTSLRRAPLVDSSDLALQTYSSLLADTTQLGERFAAGFGHQVSSRAVVQQGVERGVANTVSLTDGVLVTSTRENDTFESRSAVDAGGRLIWARNEAGAITSYDYDAIGRIVSVTLVDGTRHHLSFDAFGRPAQVSRDGLGTISYFYDPATGRLVHKDYVDADAELERTVAFEYDSIGRIVERVHVQPESGNESRFTFRYDGDVGDGEILAGQKGHLTQLEGPAYSATTVHNPDGSEAMSSLVVAGWMQIDVTTTYYAGGAVKDSHRTVTRLSDGAVIDDVSSGHIYDAFGRLDRITLNGSVLATIHYDNDGRIAWVDLAGEQRIDHLYDPTTHRQSGYTQTVDGGDGNWQTGVQWTFNNRGFIADEAIDLSDQSWLRSYAYDSRGYLDRAEDAEHLSTYTYTSAGLPNQIADERGTRTVFRGSSRTIDVGDIPYVYDASGRVTARGDATFTYGPDGNLFAANQGARTLVYHYDADGNRLLKYENGVPVAAYLGGAHLTNDTFVDPVKIGGRLVGVLENGVFQFLATDPRGTLLADRDGTPRLATPYGVRITRPDLSAALDYVEKSYDADLESVRMGVRDYDPLLGQFWTPDPLYLEAIEKCAESPVDCNLFSYARNNPINFTDPTGTEPPFKLPSGLPSQAYLQHVARTGAPPQDYDVQGELNGIAARAFGRGFVHGLASSAESVGNLVLHPIQSGEQILNAASHPLRTLEHVSRSFFETANAITKGRDIEKLGEVAGGAAIGFGAAKFLKAVTGSVAANAGRLLCFAAGTDVHAEDGLVAIEDVDVGDLVWSRSEDTGEVALRRVSRTFVTTKQPILSLVLEGSSGESDILRVTDEHPFRTKERGWVEAGDLGIGEEILQLSGGWLRVAGATVEQKRETVYNFEVEGFHTYFVGKQGAWVHNTCGKFTWMVDGGGILGEVNANGVLTFAIEAGPASAVRGRELFAGMMKALGPEVKAIEGHWVYGSNLAKVNELTRTGMSLQHAATKTWTATQAAAHGFGNVTVQATEGSAGAFTRVQVVFTR